MDSDPKGGRSFGIGGYKGRIIFLGDGTEVLTDSDDTEMFDNVEEDQDLESQVSKNAPPSSTTTTAEARSNHVETPSAHEKAGSNGTPSEEAKAPGASPSQPGSGSTLDGKKEEAKSV